MFTKEDLCYWVMDNMAEHPALRKFEVCKDEKTGAEYFQIELVCGAYRGLRVFCDDGTDTMVDSVAKITKIEQSRLECWAVAGIVSYDKAKTYIEEFAEYQLTKK